jgi:hypothetical protein
MCVKCEKNIDLEQEEFANEQECQGELDCTSEEIMGQISVEEEIKRIQIQENPISKISEEHKNGELYKNLIEQAEVIGACFQTLIGFGIDYSNSLAMASNLNQNRVETEKIKLQQIMLQQQQL